MEHGRSRKRERSALGLSVLLHAFGAPLFVAVFVGVNDFRPEGPAPAEGVFSITVAHRAAPAPARPALATKVTIIATAPVSAPARSQNPLVAAAAQRHSSGTPSKHARRVVVLAPLPTPLPTPTHHTQTAAPVRSTVAASDANAGPAPQAAAAAATTEPTAQPVKTVALTEAPIGGWGQNFQHPMVLDDDALAELRAHYHGTVVHIDVSEDGHATRVSVQGSGLDADAVAEIERRLMAARYAPAECNGLPCAAPLDIKV
jgi:hypothetical protein